MNDLIKPRRSMSRKKVGLLLLLVPPLLLILVFFAFGMLAGMAGPDGVDPNTVLGKYLPSIGSFLAIVLVIAGIGLLIGFPVGIYLLATAGRPVPAAFDERSGKGAWSEVPPEILGWNWGAAGLSWIWGVSNGVWISLLVLLPVVNYFFWIILGLRGSEWAWKAKKWQSVESFQATQRKWKPWGIAFFSIGLSILLISLVFVTMNPAKGPFSFDLEKGFSFTPLTNQSTGIADLNGKRVGYRVSYDRAKWQMLNNRQRNHADSDYELLHRDGDIFAILLAERVGNVDSLSEVILNNARELDPGAELVSKVMTQSGERTFELLRIEFSISGAPYLFYGNFYSGEEGTVQFVVACPENLFNRYRDDIKELVDSLVIL